MSQTNTYRCWFKDDSAMMVCAESESEAKTKAEALSREQMKDGYFATKRERVAASTVKEIESLDY